MKISKEEIKALNPCNAGYEWYLKNQNDDLMTLLLKLNDHKPDWARWLFSRIMSRRQRIMIAVFSAKSVLEKFERAYPDDDRPRRAIEAAESCIDNATAYAAAYAAEAAAYASDASDAAAYAAKAAEAAAYAAKAADAAAYASAAAYAAYAAFYASDASYAANAAFYASDAAEAAEAARKDIQESIIKEAVRILESERRD